MKYCAAKYIRNRCGIQTTNERVKVDKRGMDGWASFGMCTGKSKVRRRDLEAGQQRVGRNPYL